MKFTRLIAMPIVATDVVIHPKIDRKCSKFVISQKMKYES